MILKFMLSYFIFIRYLKMHHSALCLREMNILEHALLLRHLIEEESCIAISRYYVHYESKKRCHNLKIWLSINNEEWYKKHIILYRK